MKTSLFFFICFMITMGALVNYCSKEIPMESDSKDEKFISTYDAFAISESEVKKLEHEAVLGSPEAAFKLYQFYDFVKLDFKQGLYWVTISAENGHPIGQHNFAYKLMDDPDPNNRLRARYWAKKSYQNGNKDALELLKEIESKK